MATFFTWVPRLYNCCTALSQFCNNLRSTSKHHQYYGFTRCQQLLDILFLSTRQSQAFAVTVLATQHHVLADSSHNDICLSSQRQCLILISLLASIDLTV